MGINGLLQVVVPAGQVEIVTTGHFEDFNDAALILRSDVDSINNLILVQPTKNLGSKRLCAEWSAHNLLTVNLQKVGDIKLRMMRRQIEFRKGILSKEWEHAQMKMKLRHMREELYSYERLKVTTSLYCPKREYFIADPLWTPIDELEIWNPF